PATFRAFSFDEEAMVPGKQATLLVDEMYVDGVILVEVTLYLPHGSPSQRSFIAPQIESHERDPVPENHVTSLQRIGPFFRALLHPLIEVEVAAVWQPDVVHVSDGSK